MDEASSVLGEVGLSEKEIKVYLALLQLKEETASKISEIAHLNRITTYTLLKSLAEKGFCSVFEKNSVKYFKVLRPELIPDLLEEKKEKIRKIIPKLKEREAKIPEKSEISVFEGARGVVSVMNILLQDAKNKKELFGYGNIAVTEELIENEVLYFRKIRMANKIVTKNVSNSKGKKEMTHYEKWDKYTFIKINEELVNLNLYVNITENYVSYCILEGGLRAILIKDKEIVKKEKFNFEQLWKTAK